MHVPTKTSRARTRWASEVGSALACVASAIVLTWPLVTVLTWTRGG